MGKARFEARRRLLNEALTAAATARSIPGDPYVLTAAGAVPMPKATFAREVPIGYDLRYMRYLLLLAASLTFAQNAPHIREWKPDASEPVGVPKAPCAGLHALTGYDLSVMTVDAVPASANSPAFCRLVILVQPEIRIEVSLPANWNRRLYMFGNGGYAGENLEAANRVAHRNAALGSGSS